MEQSKARVTAIGTYVPEHRLTNHELAKMVDTSDEWITQRTGIKERRIAAENEFTSDLAVAAIRNLIERYQKSMDDVDMIIVATTTSDYIFPSVASQVQKKIGMKQTGAIDVNAACGGFGYALHLANGLITSGLHQKILVIGSETMSRSMDYEDRSTCILFGDGAGAFLVERDEHNPSFLSYHLTTEGEGGIHLYRSGTATMMDGVELKPTGHLVQNGREVYRWAVTTVPQGMQKLLDKSSYTLSQVDWFVPHSANKRMIESICEKSGFPLEKTLISLEYCGNTSSASIPLSLDMAVQDGRVKKGDKILIYGFGGGLTQAGLLLEWGVES